MPYYSVVTTAVDGEVREHIFVPGMTNQDSLLIVFPTRGVVDRVLQIVVHRFDTETECS